MIVTLGILGSIASVIGLLIAAPDRKSRVIHILYMIFIVCISVAMLSYQQKASDAELRISEMQRIEVEAAKLLSGYDFTTTASMAGFMLASLSFLEKHREQYPDTYKRAVDLCMANKCIKANNGDYGESMEYFEDMQHASFAMEYLIKGIAHE